MLNQRVSLIQHFRQFLREFLPGQLGFVIHTGQGLILIGLIGRCLRHFFPDLRHRGDDGNVVDGVALHVSHQRLAHLHGIRPAIGGIGLTGLQQDLCHLIIGIDGRGQDVFGGVLHLRQLAVVENLVQNQTQSVGIHGGVGAVHFVLQFRSGIGAAVLGRQGSQIQTFQFHQTQITDPVFPVVGDEDVGGLQIRVDPAGPAGGGQGIANVNTQINGTQVSHGVPADILLQSMTVAGQQIHPIAQVAMFHGDYLPAFKRQKAFQSGQIFQTSGFPLHGVRQFTEIFQRCGGFPKGAGQQQSVHLGLGCGDRDNFNNIFFIRVFLQCGIAAHTVMLAEGGAHGKAIQQRRDKFRFRQSQSPPYTHLSYTKNTKKATRIYAELIKC